MRRRWWLVISSRIGKLFTRELPLRVSRWICSRLPIASSCPLLTPVSPRNASWKYPDGNARDRRATTWILFGSLPTGQLFADRQDDALHARMMDQSLPAHEASPPLHCVHGTDRAGNAAKLMETLCLGCTSVSVVSSYEAKADST